MVTIVLKPVLLSVSIIRIGIVLAFNDSLVFQLTATASPATVLPWKRLKLLVSEQTE